MPDWEYREIGGVLYAVDPTGEEPPREADEDEIAVWEQEHGPLSGAEPAEVPLGTTTTETAATNAGRYLDGGTSFRDTHPDEASILDQWNAQQKLAGGPTLGDAKAEAALGYMEPFGLEDFGQALSLYSRYMYQPELGIPMPSQAAQFVTDRFAESEEEARAWTETVMGQAPAAPSGLSAEALATPVGQAIAAVTDDPAVQAAMWAGAGLEGSQEGPWETAAGGAHVGGDGEVGPWQIHPVHFENITPEAAADPNSAALYMLPRYEDAVLSVPRELWQTDPNAALALTIANAERPEGWHTDLTADEALAIYGGSERVGGAATGAAAGAGPSGWPAGPYRPPVEPTGVPALTRQEHAQWVEYNQFYDMPQDVFKAALTLGRNPLEYWLEIEELQLAQELEAGNITREEYDEGVALRLSLDQITRAKELGIPFADYRAAINAGLAEYEIADALQLWGYSLEEYLWARQQGVSHAQVQAAHLSNTPLVEVVSEARIAEVEAKADVEFTAAWNKMLKGVPETTLASPGFSAWVNRRADEEWERYREQRMTYERRRVERELGVLEEPLRPIPAGTMPVIGPGKEQIYWEPGKDGQPGRYGVVAPEEEPEPEPITLPTTDELIMEAVRSGVVPAYQPLGEGEVTGQGAATTAYREPASRRGVYYRGGYEGVGGFFGTRPPAPAATQRMTPIGGEAFRIQLGRGLYEREQRTGLRPGEGARGEVTLGAVPEGMARPPPTPERYRRVSLPGAPLVEPGGGLGPRPSKRKRKKERESVSLPTVQGMTF